MRSLKTIVSVFFRRYGSAKPTTCAIAHAVEVAHGGVDTIPAMAVNVLLNFGCIAAAANCCEGGWVGLGAIIMLDAFSDGIELDRFILNCGNQTSWWCCDRDPHGQRDYCQEYSRLRKHRSAVGKT